MNLPAAAGLSEVTKAKLWFIAFKASQTSHWRFHSVTKQRRKLPCIDKWSKGQVEFWQNTIWEFSIFALWVREPPQVFIFPLLWTCTFTCSCTRCTANRVRGVVGILFRMASRQTAIIATSCSIWPHEILAFTTSAFPSFYSLYILTHFQVFTVQSHATQLTALCADAVMWVTLLVSYFHLRLFCLGGGGGRVRCFCVVICEGSCINPFW